MDYRYTLTGEWQNSFGRVICHTVLGTFSDVPVDRPQTELFEEACAQFRRLRIIKADKLTVLHYRCSPDAV